MNLVIKSFTDAGDTRKERLILKAKANLDIGAYAVLYSGAANDGNPTSGGKLAYWFPDAEIKAGDLVVLYTKSGERSTKPFKVGSGMVHFFYWGQDKAMWGDNGVGAVVLSVEEWQWKQSM